MALTGRFKADTTRMRSQADTIRAAIGEFRSQLDEYDSLIGGTEYYWTGEAAQAYRRLYKGQKSLVEEMLARLSSQVRELEQLAGIYDRTESTNARQVETLELPKLNI